MKIVEEIPANAIGSGNIDTFDPLLFRSAGIIILLKKATEMMKRNNARTRHTKTTI